MTPDPDNLSIVGVDPVAAPIDKAAKGVVLLVNRTAGAGGGSEALCQAEQKLRSLGLSIHRASGVDQLVETTSRLAKDKQLRAVVAVGGDGTVGMALNHTPEGTPLAVFPAGTENLLAKYLKQRPRAESIARLLEQGVVVRLDAGEANGRLFTLMISIGFDAEVVRRVHVNRRGNITHLAYAKPILDALRNYRFPKSQVRWESANGETGAAVGRWLFGMNLPRYAQGLPIAPRATGTDGQIDLCVFERGHLHAALWYLWHLMRRRHLKLPSVSIRCCQRFEALSLTDDLIPYQLDGDPGGFLPVEVKTVPQRLTCIVKPSVAQMLGFQLPVSTT